MSNRKLLPTSIRRSQAGLTLLAVVIVVGILVIVLAAIFWPGSGITPFISQVVPPAATATVDVHGAFTLQPSMLGNTAFRVVFKLMTVPAGTTVNANWTTAPPPTATPLAGIPVSFALSGPVRLAAGSALTTTTTAAGDATVVVIASGSSPPPGKVTVTVTIGGQTGTDSVSFEVDRTRASQ